MTVKKTKAQTKSVENKLIAFVGRRHPEYERLKPHWEFLDATYTGGREWFANNIFQYLKEGNEEFAARVKRAYRFNHTREVVDLVDKYLFKMPIDRNDAPPASVKKFWANATLNGLDIRDLMKRVSNKTSKFGRIWIVVDSNKTSDVESVADEKEANVRTYAYTVDPLNMCDFSRDDAGELIWALIHEQVRDDADPLNSSGAMLDRYRLWERHQSTIFTVSSGSDTHAGVAEAVRAVRAGKVGNVATIDPAASIQGQMRVSMETPVAHGFGAVPIFHADHIISDEPYSSQSMIDEVAYLDRAVANYLSNMDAIIQDQTFSQLVIPAGGLPETSGKDELSAKEKMVTLGTSRIFTYNAEGGAAPAFISPDVKQAEMIMSAINKIIAEIYHTTGLSGERTKDDNGAGIDNSSGVAKAYDFERVNSMLASKADSLELTEKRLAQYVARWNGEEIPDDVRLVSYPDNFDVRGLRDEFSIATSLALIEAPDTVRREQMMTLIKKLFPQPTKELMAKIEAELKDWPPEPPPEETAGAPTASPKGKQADVKKTATTSLARKAAKENA